MGNFNSHIIEISAEKLYKLAQTSNREAAVADGFYDGRFMSRTIESKKKVQHLKLRRDKHTLKRIDNI